MKLREFRRLVDAYGADAMRWPEQKRDAALALALASEEARQAWAEAMQLDRALATVVPAIGPERIAELRLTLFERTAALHPPGAALAGRLAGLWRWPSVLVLGTMALLGFFVGFTQLAPSATEAASTVDVFSFDLGPLASLER